MGASHGFVCNAATLPGIAWAAAEDQTDPHLGITCERLDTPLPGFNNFTSWASFWKLLRLIA